MDKSVLDYLSRQRVGCLSIVGTDNKPIASAVHFASTSDGQLFVQVGKESRKYQTVKDGTCLASFTVGFDENDWITLQMDGKLRQIEVGEEQQFLEVYYTKNPNAKKYRGDDTAYLIFEPTWWRYSDYSVGETPKIISSD